MGKTMCDLCNAVPEASYESFFLLTCRKCGVPMLVLHDHRDWITADEFYEMISIAQRVCPGYHFRGRGMFSVPSHYHEHLCPPGTSCPL